MAHKTEAAGAPGPLIWSLPEPPGRPTTTLSRAVIVAAAIEIADAEGARALTMRRIGAAVGAATPMSLYRYVGSKDGLVDLMIDAVYGEIPLPDRAGHWRAAFERLALDTWTVVLRHLWFAELVHTRPPIGPNALRYFDFRFSLLEPLGLSADDMSRLTDAVDGHLIGAALALTEETRMRERTGLHTDEELAATAAPLLEPLLADGRYPSFARWHAARSPSSPADNVEWSLRCLLDGVTARLAIGEA